MANKNNNEAVGMNKTIELNSCRPNSKVESVLPY